MKVTVWRISLKILGGNRLSSEQLEAKGVPANAGVASPGSVAKFVSLSDNWPFLVIEKSDD